jgi:hypothetical protein
VETDKDEMVRIRKKEENTSLPRRKINRRMVQKEKRKRPVWQMRKISRNTRNRGAGRGRGRGGGGWGEGGGERKPNFGT